MSAIFIFRCSSLLVLQFLLFGCKGQEPTDKTLFNQEIEKAATHLYKLPQNIAAKDTSPGWSQPGQKILLTGTIYKNDGKTPAPHVLVYYYHTNTAGKYVHQKAEPRSMPPNSQGQTHGYIRGWVKSDQNGRYAIYTVRPGAYPGWRDPAHIHLTIKEPDREDAYYIDDVVFDDDSLLTTEKRLKMENRCGSGVVRMVQQGDLNIGERNIILGLHIPGYPQQAITTPLSGSNIGEDIFSFTPAHAWGPDKGTKTCPVCKYGWYHGILYFVGNKPNWTEIKQWLLFLEAESIKREKYLKVYFIYGNEKGYSKADREQTLANLGETLKLKKTALTYVPSFADKASDVYLNKINPDVENTFLLYKRNNVIGKYINLKPVPENYALLSKRLDETINEFFDLPNLLQED
jgi:protocatechuate 3,4-dioxygenase, beta subunit